MSKQNMLRYDCSFRRLKRRSKTKNFLSISFSASRRRGGGRRRRENARKFFGFCTRESASVSEAHCLAPPRNRSVRRSFKPPRAPRVRSGFAERLIHHRILSKSQFWEEVASALRASAGARSAPKVDSARIRHAPRGVNESARF